MTAPIVIGRDHLDSGSVASPYRETEAMADGSDAIADWPILNALLNVASGAAWVAVHHGGGVGMGKSIHAGAQVVADGSDEAAVRLERVLTNDPGTGVMRHADAGYDRARQVAEERGVRIPMGPNRSPQPPDHAGRRGGGALNGGRGAVQLLRTARHRGADSRCRAGRRCHLPGMRRAGDPNQPGAHRPPVRWRPLGDRDRTAGHQRSGRGRPDRRGPRRRPRRSRREGRLGRSGGGASLPVPDLPELDCEGRAVIPGFVDSHTHLVFAGERSIEFGRRRRGERYEDIAAAGGGIRSTVAATRQAGPDSLMEDAIARAGRMLAAGTTTVEVKSGYGLEPLTEVHLLEVANEIGERLPIDVVPTFLGAHAIPEEFEDLRQAYLWTVTQEMLPVCAPLARFCDASAIGALSIRTRRGCYRPG